MLRILVGVLLAASMTIAAEAADVPAVCAGGVSLGSFQLQVSPFAPGPPLSLKSVAEIEGGSRLIWNPVHFFPPPSHDAEVAAVLVPAQSRDLILTLEPRKAMERTEWQLPERPHVIALIYGPQGLSEGKIKSLVTHNRELLAELADYAEQSSEVEALVQDLTNAEETGAGASAVFQGISSKYGVTSEKLNSTPSYNDQAALLLKAVLPAASSYDPLGAANSQAQQSGSLAASVAGLFFGNPVALAAGGAALFADLKTVLFPETEFRSAFTQTAPKDALALCTKNRDPKAKTKLAYLWAYRAPEIKKPTVTFSGPVNLPLGSKSTVEVKFTPASASKDLGLARDWKLTRVDGTASLPVDVQLTGADRLQLDLSKIKTAGDYRLTAAWDWEMLEAGGTLHLRPYSDLSHAEFTPAERDKLVEGNGGGEVEASLSGADFEFLEKVQIEGSARHAKPSDIEFTLPLGKGAGPQDSVKLELDTTKPGRYRLLLSQSDGVAHEVPLIILPPDPKLSHLPVRLNEGEAREAIHLQGEGMERIVSVSSAAGKITGEADGADWSGEIALKSGLQRGKRFPLTVKVQGLDAPMTVPDALEVVGPRPGITAVRRSLAEASGVELAGDELPAGAAAGMALMIDHMEASAHPRLELGCASGEMRQAMTLSPGDPAHGASLTFAGPGALYLSVDPGAVGYAGCRLEATVIVEPEGRSDPFVLGRVVRIPRLDSFALTTEKVGESSYAGILKGSDLDVIDRVGWDAQNGVPVTAIATPIPGDSVHQTLRLVLPWPAPAPHAPLYIWLRGEAAGRKTAVTY